MRSGVDYRDAARIVDAVADMILEETDGHDLLVAYIRMKSAVLDIFRGRMTRRTERGLLRDLAERLRNYADDEEGARK